MVNKVVRFLLINGVFQVAKKNITHIVQRYWSYTIRLIWAFFCLSFIYEKNYIFCTKRYRRILTIITIFGDSTVLMNMGVFLKVHFWFFSNCIEMLKKYGRYFFPRRELTMWLTIFLKLLILPKTTIKRWFCDGLRLGQRI